MARCDRIYFAVQQLAIAREGSSTYTAVKGAQTLSLGLDVPLQEIFQLGRLEVYQQLEDLPDTNVSVDKVLDGNPLIYHLATRDATTPTLAGRANARCSLALSVFDSTNDSASGVPEYTVQMTGMYYQNISYTFSVGDAFRESISFIGNDILVSNDAKILNTADQARSTGITVNGQFTGVQNPPDGVNRKQHLIFAYNAATLDSNMQVAEEDATILPSIIDGISNSGTNEFVDNAYNSNVQSITVSANITRERTDQLGTLEPVCRYIQFPVEVTTEIQVVPRSHGLVSATANGILNTGNSACWNGDMNLKNHTIRVASCEGTRIFLGKKNKLQSLNYSGGDAGGGSVNVSYTFRTFNDFTVMHDADPHSSGATWWTNRATYLL